MSDDLYPLVQTAAPKSSAVDTPGFGQEGDGVRHLKWTYP